MTEKHKKIISGICVVLFVVLMILLGILEGVPVVRMASDPEALAQWVDSFGIWGRLLFVGIVVFQVLVAFVPGEPIELAGGYLFGALEGYILSMGGILMGSWIIFLLVRRFGIKLVEVFFSKESIEEVSFLKNPKKTRVLAFILMTIPGTPKDFLSYFAGLTQISLWQWLVIVVVSRSLSVITSTISGAAAGAQNYLLSGTMLALSGLLSAIGIVYYRRICKQEKENDNKNPTA